MFTGMQLANFCLSVYAAKWVYWYGTYGKKCSKSLYESKRKQYPSHYGDSRTAGYMKDIAEGRTCADCVGMIKAFFWKGGDLDATPVYKSNNCPDVSANGMIKLCEQTGAISTIPDVPGLVVWKDGHIGVYVGDGYTVEMKGFNYDCKKNKVKDGPWVKWGRLPASMISYTDEPTPEPEPVGERDLKNGDTGPDVQQMQEDLISLGYSCGKWGADGEFGDCTEMAVEAFQRDHGLPVTGVYDAATREAMDKALDEANKPVDPPAEPKTVEIVGGDCYVRTAPNTSGKKLGVAHEGDRLPYGGETSANGWNLVEYKGQNGWVSGKYSRLIDGGGAASGTVICDVSQNQGRIDWDRLAPELAYVVIKASGKYANADDDEYARNVAGAVAHGVPFHVYCYLYCLTEAEARRDAGLFYRTVAAGGHWPLFWVLDLEAGWGAPDRDVPKLAAAFEAELRRLCREEGPGEIRVAAYVAQEKYYHWALDYDGYAYLWIPGYGERYRPPMPCDVWQYTSDGRLPGIAGRVDLDVLTGRRPLAYFITP